MQQTRNVEKLLKENGLDVEYATILKDLRSFQITRDLLKEKVDDFVEKLKKVEKLIRRLDYAAEEMLEERSWAIDWQAFSRLFLSFKDEYKREREDYWDQREGERARGIAALMWSRMLTNVQIERLKDEQRYLDQFKLVLPWFL